LKIADKQERIADKSIKIADKPEKIADKPPKIADKHTTNIFLPSFTDKMFTPICLEIWLT